jgi:penicillin-binding protein 1A
MDSIKYYLKILNTGFMAIDPYTGELKAYIGGNDFSYFKYDHTTAKRQVGSTFKPIVYLGALEAGVSPDTYFANERKVYTDYDDWSPKNSHDEYVGYYSMEGALSKSINTIAVEVLMKAGISNVIDLAKKMGIDSDLPPYPSLALGAASVSLQEMVCAYSTLVNGGRRITPYYLKSIESNAGKVLEKFANTQSQDTIASPENCHIVTRMLKSVIDQGTGNAIRSTWGIDSEFAGKTGTTQDQADGWFIGMTPKLVAGAWVGGEDPSIHFSSLGEGAGGRTALPIVGEFYSQILRKGKYQNLRNSFFESPSEETLALMDIPPYRDVLDSPVKSFLRNIFGKSDNVRKPAAQDGRKDETVQAEQAQKQKPEQEKKPFWQTMKEIFKKKNQ